MPTMANVTIKMADNATNIVYDALAGSGGDGAPAVWRQDTGAPAGLPVGFRPKFQMGTMWNGPKTARQEKFYFSYPYAVQDSTTTLYSSKDKVVFDGILTVPQGIPATAISEAVAQVTNLLGATLIKAAANAGYAPT